VLRCYVRSGVVPVVMSLTSRLDEGISGWDRILLLDASLSKTEFV
jgi:hypothetical protein